MKEQRYVVGAYLEMQEFWSINGCFFIFMRSVSPTLSMQYPFLLVFLCFRLFVLWFSSEPPGVFTSYLSPFVTGHSNTELRPLHLIEDSQLGALAELTACSLCLPQPRIPSSLSPVDVTDTQRYQTSPPRDPTHLLESH